MEVLAEADGPLFVAHVHPPISKTHQPAMHADDLQLLQIPVLAQEQPVVMIHIHQLRP